MSYNMSMKYSIKHFDVSFASIKSLSLLINDIDQYIVRLYYLLVFKSIKDYICENIGISHTMLMRGVGQSELYTISKIMRNTCYYKHNQISIKIYCGQKDSFRTYRMRRVSCCEGDDCYLLMKNAIYLLIGHKVKWSIKSGFS
jgi:hypothetical protein